MEFALVYPGYRPFDLARRKLERIRRPAVEFLRQFAHRRVTPRLDVDEYFFHRLAHLGIGGFYRARVDSALEIASHRGLPFHVLSSLSSGVNAIGDTCPPLVLTNPQPLLAWSSSLCSYARRPRTNILATS